MSPADVWHHRTGRVNGVRLHWVEAGGGEPVVLLHGFPDFWWSWRHQIGVLAAAGHRVIALDLRGYNESARPRGRKAYALERVVADVEALIGDVAGGRAAVVGHDWGGVAAWRLAERHADRVARLVIINAPHPRAYLRAVLRTTQLLRSWYVFAAQLPWLPEQVLAAGRAHVLARYFEREADRHGGFDAADIAVYRRVFSTADSLRGPLNYYRNALRLAGSGAGGRTRQRIAAPTLVLWGERDAALHPSLADGLERHAERVEVRRFGDAGHWLHRSRPAAVNEAITTFLR